MSRVRILSASQLDTFRRCPLAWTYKHVEHAPDERKSGALVVGSTVDVSVKSIVHEMRDKGTAPSPSDVEETCRRAWAGELASCKGVPIQWGERGDEKKGVDTALGLVRAFAALPDLGKRVERIVALDVKFELALVDPLTGLEEPGLRVTGFLDAVEKSPSTGKLRPLDYKTSAGRAGWNDPSDIQELLQAGLYPWALRQLHGDAAADEMAYLIGFKTKEAVWEDREVVLGEPHQRRALLVALQVARAMATGYRWPNPNFTCSSCGHLDKCRRWQDTPISSVARDVFAA